MRLSFALYLVFQDSNHFPLGHGSGFDWPVVLRVKMNLTRMRRIGLVWLLLCCGVSVLWGVFLERASPNGLADFKAIYYGARCLILHSDPYKESEFLHVYQAEGGGFPSDPARLQIFRRAVPVCINLPTALLVAAPFSILAWGSAHLLWMILTAGVYLLAACLMWKLARNYAPGISLFLICMVLANSEILFSGGNLAGIAVSLCVVAVWCFLEKQYLPAGILCLAVSLAIKPHDAGLVWLYFLLAGGVYRKRALQTLVVTVVLALAAILWVTSIAPQWMGELNSNLQATMAPGALNAPGPSSVSFRSSNMLIDLQTVISVFRDDPRIYNPASYLICGTLLLVWSIRTLRARFSRPGAWIALAAIAALSMLPVYHRQYDAKLLLLTVPACAMLWAEGGLTGWIALLVNSAGVVVTGDIPSAILLNLTGNLRIPAAGLCGKILTVVLLQPAPFILLLMGIFYLWVYLRRDPAHVATAESGEPGESPLAPTQA